jgi:hypothetical protein
VSPREGYIYAVQVGTSGPIKIGFTTQPRERVASIQDFCPWPLRTLFIAPGNILNEAWVHSQCGAARMKAESFKATPAVRTLLAEIASDEWIWPTVIDTRRLPRKGSAQADHAKRLVQDAALPMQPGDTIARQIDRAADRLGMAKQRWRVRSAWYGEATSWPLEAVADLEARCAAYAKSREAA